MTLKCDAIIPAMVIQPHNAKPFKKQLYINNFLHSFNQSGHVLSLFRYSIFQANFAAILTDKSHNLICY